MQILQPRPRPTKSNLGWHPEIWVLTSSSGDSDVWAKVWERLVQIIKQNHFEICLISFVLFWQGKVCQETDGVGLSQDPLLYHNQQELPKIWISLCVSCKIQFNSHTLFLPVHTHFVFACSFKTQCNLESLVNKHPICTHQVSDSFRLIPIA